MTKLMSIVLLVPLLAVALLGCSKEAKSPEAKRPQQPSVQYAGKLVVRILPEIPTAADDLQVIYTGSGSAAYRWEKNGAVIAGETGARLARKWLTRGDRITAVVTANGEEGRATLSVENALPQVTAVSVTPENICRGVDITAAPTGVDTDGDPVSFTFRWFINGQEVSERSAVLKGESFKCGDKVSLKVTPHDANGAGAEYATQAFAIPPAAPYFVSQPSTAFSGATYVYEAKAVDPDGDVINYALVSAPPGMSINKTTGRMEWQVTGRSGDYGIELEARNSRGGIANQKYTLTVTIP